MDDDSIIKLVEGSTDKFDTANLVLSFADWAKRQLPPPDCVCGSWLTTTSRVLLWAETGIGKTVLSLALACGWRRGAPFCTGWRRAPPACCTWTARCRVGC